MKYSQEEQTAWHNALPSKRTAATVMFTDEQGQILVVKPNYRDFWNFPGGVVDENESPLDAAVREVNEELNLTISKDSLRLIMIDYVHKHDDGKEDFIFFEFDGGVLSNEQIAQITIPQDELDEFKFVPKASVGEFIAEIKTKRFSSFWKSGKRFAYLEDGEFITGL